MGNLTLSMVCSEPLRDDRPKWKSTECTRYLYARGPPLNGEEWVRVGMRERGLRVGMREGGLRVGMGEGGLKVVMKKGGLRVGMGEGG